MAFELTSVLDVVVGPDTAAATLESLSVDTTLVVVDPALAGAPYWARFADAGRMVTVADGEPTSGSVQAVVDVTRTASVDVVVTVGGGSTLDTGKIVASMYGEEGSPVVSQHLLGAKPLHRTAGLVAVPTTAGSGAEATRTCVLSHEGRKSWLFDEALAPDRVVLDPGTTVGIPPAVTVATGLDAFVHAVEAFTNRRCDDVADDAALAAIAAIAVNLPAVLDRPDDLDARGRMLEAATAAGIAIDRCGTAMGHCVGHALAHFGPLPHGLAVALGLRASLEWSMEGDPDRFGAVATAMADASSAPLPKLVDDLLARVGFDRLLARWPGETLDPELLAFEMALPENLPMAMAGARTPDGSDLLQIATSVLRRRGDR